MRIGLIGAVALVAGFGLPLAVPHALRAEGTVAAPEAAPNTLADILQTEALFDAIAEEGAQVGRDIDASLLADMGGPGWHADVARAYDPAALRPRFEAALDRAMTAAPAARDAAMAFFGSPLGQRIITLEIGARRALIDADTREAAEVKAERMGEKRDPRLRAIRRMIEAGDMIELGVAGTLGAYLAFNDGLADAVPAELAGTAEDRSADVYAQEAQIRADTTTWLISYMVLAYAPLTDDELAAYADFIDSPDGKAYNAAVFAAYDAAMIPVSRDLGRAAGRSLSGSDI